MGECVCLWTSINSASLSATSENVPQDEVVIPPLKSKEAYVFIGLNNITATQL